MSRRTVRMRTTATALGVVGAALVLAAVALVVLLHRALVDDVDAQARFRLDDVAALARRGQVPARLAGDDDRTVAQVVAGGRVIAPRPGIHATTPLAPYAPTGTDAVVRPGGPATPGD